MNHVEVLFSPAEFQALKGRNLSQTTCVVFDILRATSTIVTALAHGAKSVLAVESIEAALAEKKKHPALLLAGERDGFRIKASQTGSIDFDLGNSPREFTSEKISGKEIAITTTNGSRAIWNCSQASRVFIGSFLNLQAVADAVIDSKELLLICSGTHEEASYEDTLGAGALCELLWSTFANANIADSARIARIIKLEAGNDLLAAMDHARNGRRLLSIPELRDDVAFCLQQNIFQICPHLKPNGTITL
jgi:2-phosphosulfolactate phosphatase